MAYESCEDLDGVVEEREPELGCVFPAFDAFMLCRWYELDDMVWPVEIRYAWYEFCCVSNEGSQGI